MYITVHVRGDTASEQSAASGRRTRATEELSELATRLGVSLEPMHPGTQDPSLRKYFKIEVPDLPTAERVLPEIVANRAVEAAYVKPDEELP